MTKAPRRKCLEVFNSVILFEWFRELLKEQSNPTSKLNLAHKDFNAFIRSHKYLPGPHKIEIREDNASVQLISINQRNQTKDMDLIVPAHAIINFSVNFTAAWNNIILKLGYVEE